MTPDAREPVPENGPTGERRSGYEIADSALDKASSAASVAGRGLLILYGLVLIAIGILGMVVGGGFGMIIAALLFIGYGIYLVLGGSWVIY